MSISLPLQCRNILSWIIQLDTQGITIDDADDDDGAVGDEQKRIYI